MAELTQQEQEEYDTLKDEIVSKVNNPKAMIYKGCVKRGTPPDKVVRFRELNIKKTG